MRHTVGQTGSKTDKQTWIGRQTWTDRQTDRRIDRKLSLLVGAAGFLRVTYSLEFASAVVKLIKRRLSRAASRNIPCCILMLIS